MNKKLNDATKHIKMQGQSLDFGGRAIINAKLVNCEGAGGGGSDPNAVKYTEQNLTDLQKAQARTNIGAGSAADVSANAAAIAAETSRAVAAEGTLQEMISAIDRGEGIVAWDGASTPVVAEIPAGVTVTYNNVDYTGTLAASSDTKGPVYYVADGNGNATRYMVSQSGSTYSWLPIGTTEIDLTQYATKAELNQLDQEVTVSDTMSVIPTILAGYRVDGTQLKIIAVSDESTYYIPVANGKAYTIAYALTSGPARYGFFTQQPANGVAVTSNYLRVDSAQTIINFVAPSDGYFAISFVTANITSVAFTTKKEDGIGLDVFLLNEKARVIDQILEKKSVQAEDTIAGQVIKFSDGTLTAAEGFNVAVFRISEGLTYFASGVVPTDVTRTGIAMYDASMQYVAFDAQGDSVGRAYSDKRLVIPSGVAYLRIVGTSNNPAALVSQFNAPDILSTQNLFVTTDYSGFINASGVHSANSNLDSCLLQLIPGKTYRFVQQVISTTGNYVRIYKFNNGTLTQQVAYQGKVPVVYKCPSDGIYYAQVIDDTRVIDSKPAIFIASAGIDEMVADLAATRQSLKVLFVGNSHSRDSFSYLPMLLENEVPGISLHLGILYQGACTLAQHYDNISNGTTYPEWDEYTSEAGAWVTDSNGKTFDQAVAIDKWDIIVLQQRSHIAGNYSVYEPYLSDIVELFGQKVSYPVKLGWFMVFALADDYVDQPEESSDAQYATIAEATQEMMEHSPFEFVIPVATAIQNARQIPALKALGTGGDMTYEGLHLQEGLPCLCAAYSAALKFLEVMGLGRIGIYGNQVRPSAAWLTSHNIPQQNGTIVGVTTDNCIAAQRCAMFSIRRPYELSPAID